MSEFKQSDMVGVCPVCKGSCRVLLPVEHQSYKDRIAEYDPVTNTIPCNNCGGQKMFTKPSGIVPLRWFDNSPCEHEYSTRVMGNCYTQYTCKFCTDMYNIDSGD